MNDELLLMRAICEHPAEDTPRLMYADAIQEARPDRAEFIRVQCELARLVAAGTADPKRGVRAVYADGTIDYTTPPDFARWKKLDARERELREVRIPTPDAHRPELVAEWAWAPRCVDAMRMEEPPQWERGFIGLLTCTADDFLKYADALLWHPEQTEECSFCEGGGSFGACDFGGGVVYPTCSCHRGRVPRPFPPTAQPITHLTLTTWPAWDWNEFGAAVTGRTCRDHLRGGDHDRRGIATRLLEGEFRVKVTLPGHADEPFGQSPLTYNEVRLARGLPPLPV